VPGIGLVVAGDAVYNDVHQYLAESDSQGRQDWLAGSTLSRDSVRARSSPDTSATGRTTTRAPSTKPASTSATSTGSTRKPSRRRNCTGRCWQFTRTASTPARCGCRRSRQRPEPVRLAGSTRGEQPSE
jgi:hypothetical protein